MGSFEAIVSYLDTFGTLGVISVLALGYLQSSGITVVLDVGASFNGHASCLIFTSRKTSQFCARVEPGSPQIATILT